MPEISRHPWTNMENKRAKLFSAVKIIWPNQFGSMCPRLNCSIPVVSGLDQNTIAFFFFNLQGQQVPNAMACTNIHRATCKRT